MDGVIIDSEERWAEHEGQFLSQHVPGWKPEDRERLIGRSTTDIFEILKAEHGMQMTRPEFFERVQLMALEIYRTRTQLTPHFQQFAGELQRTELSIGLASSAMRAWINIVVERFQLKELFHTTVSASEIKGSGKPAPDIYLYAAVELGVKPEDCLAIEDSAHGVHSAKSAGMKVVGFKNGFNQDQDLSKADWVVEGFESLSLSELTKRAR